MHILNYNIYAINMSYGATVGASAANSNLIKLKKYILPLSWINPMYNFSKWFIDYLKNGRGVARTVVMCRHLNETLGFTEGVGGPGGHPREIF